jgi:hypothetical protein
MFESVAAASDTVVTARPPSVTLSSADEAGVLGRDGWDEPRCAYRDKQAQLAQIRGSVARRM